MASACAGIAPTGRGPQRMCAICRKRFDKAALTRFIKTDKEGLVEDTDKILPGRGYYVCAAASCREQWLRRAARR